jgi:hypothetical protein
VRSAREWLDDHDVIHHVADSGRTFLWQLAAQQTLDQERIDYLDSLDTEGIEQRPSRSSSTPPPSTPSLTPWPSAYASP